MWPGPTIAVLLALLSGAAFWAWHDAKRYRELQWWIYAVPTVVFCQLYLTSEVVTRVATRLRTFIPADKHQEANAALSDLTIGTSWQAMVILFVVLLALVAFRFLREPTPVDPPAPDYFYWR